MLTSDGAAHWSPLRVREKLAMPAMDESLTAQVESYRSRLDSLLRQGRQIRDALLSDPSDTGAMVALRIWQEDCGQVVNQLSGGSKSHWLARSFSSAFLVRSAAASVVEEASAVEIVERLLNVLEQAVGSLSGIVPSQSSELPPLRRFDFVHDPELRPIIERAYADGRHALDRGDYELALLTACGILDAVVTDALEHMELSSVAASDVPAGKVADWPFETRLAVAERTGLIRGGWARLPAVARAYRSLADGEDSAKMRTAISELDARRTTQVLHVVMRDLDPGR